MLIFQWGRASILCYVLHYGTAGHVHANFPVGPRVCTPHDRSREGGDVPPLLDEVYASAGGGSDGDAASAGAQDGGQGPSYSGDTRRESRCPGDDGDADTVHVTVATSEECYCALEDSR